MPVSFNSEPWIEQLDHWLRDYNCRCTITTAIAPKTSLKLNALVSHFV
jgi:hypothetical protein